MREADSGPALSLLDRNMTTTSEEVSPWAMGTAVGRLDRLMMAQSGDAGILGGPN